MGNPSTISSRRRSRCHRFPGLLACLAITFAVFANVELRLNGQTDVADNDSIRSAHSQFLILKTGSVYSGQLEFSGSKYIVRRPTGAAIKFTSAEVDFISNSLDEAYLRLAAGVEPRNILAQQRLTNWCLKNRLVDRTQQQLTTLKTLAPKSAMTRLVERQLASLINPKTDQPPASDIANLETRIRELPKAGGNLKNHVELRDRVNSFSERSLRVFNRTIHPRIVNGCAAARCHGDTNQTLRLWRVSNRGGINSTGVQRNLYAISQYLNRDNPIDSELLKYVSQIHGGMETPAYSKDSHHYHAIRDWVLSTGTRSDETRQSITDISQTSFVNNPPGRPRSEQEAHPSTVAESKDWPTLPGFESDLPSPVDLNNSEKRFVPRDEFDPEIFNRKYSVTPARSPQTFDHQSLPSPMPNSPLLRQTTADRTRTNETAESIRPAHTKTGKKIKSLPAVDNNE